MCSCVFILQSCQQHTEKKEPTEEEVQRWKERTQAGVYLESMLRTRDFEHALPYIDTLHKKFPNDPQFYFIEGWVYDMQNDSLMARAAYTRSMKIYDSLIIANGNIGDMENRAAIVQILYGMDAYNKALDEMIYSTKDPNVKMAIEKLWRGIVFDKEKIY